jgi:Fur family zinc uptake transcriptional regulator
LATLEEVAQGGPVTAYRLLAALGDRLDRRLDPPTVYRALAFLLNAGLIARLEKLGAYVIRHNPEQAEPYVLLLCDRCKSTFEVEDPKLIRRIKGDAAALGFRLGGPIIECSGTCGRCAENGEAAQ